MATLNELRDNRALTGDRENASRLNNAQRSNLISRFVEFNQFNENWIRQGADDEMIDFAETLGYFLAPYFRDDRDALSTSQIRNVYGELKRIQMKGFEKEKVSFHILKPKVAYNAGRHNKIGILVYKKYFDLAYSAVSNKNEFQNFINLFESILAFHKAFGGKE